MKQITIRVPETDLERANALVGWLRADPLAQAYGGRLDRSAVLRLAISKGLELLEIEEARGKRK